MSEKFDFAMLEKEFLRLGRLCPQPKAIMDTLETGPETQDSKTSQSWLTLQPARKFVLEAAHTAAADAACNAVAVFGDSPLNILQRFRRSIPELERWIVHGEGNTGRFGTWQRF